MSDHYCCKKCGLRYDDCRCTSEPSVLTWDVAIPDVVIKFLSKHPPRISINVQSGWECPRCKTIHAPHVNSCSCRIPNSYKQICYACGNYHATNMPCPNFKFTTGT